MNSCSAAPSEILTASEKKELIKQLKFELQTIELGWYRSPGRARGQTWEIFRDSLICPNAGLDVKEHPCSSCLLSKLAPLEARTANYDTCHKIPLNAKGDTIESLKAESATHILRDAVLGWLKKTIARLEEETAINE
jgi:hypothetical protein